MKKILAVLALTISISTPVYAASGLAELQLKIHSVTTFKKLDKSDTFEKINEVSEMNYSILTESEITRDSKKNVNNDAVAYSIDKNLLRIVDTKNDLDAEAPVLVEKSILGRIKSFTITGKNYETIYFEALKRSGVVALGDMDMKKNERKSMVISDQVCSVDKATSLATCEQDIELKVLQNQFVLYATLFLLQLDI